MYDYVIVGGGVAGCVMAYRLSENPDVRVAVLEYGKAGNNKKTIVKMPLGMVTFMMPNLAFLGGPKMTYMYKGEPNQGLGGAALDLPRGKAVGGSSMINGMIVVRGQWADYDLWEEMGATGWSRDEMKKYFIKSENFEITNNPDYTPGYSIQGKPVKDLIDYDYHGTGGPYNVAPPRSPNSMCEVYFEACQQAGYKINADFNGADQEGIGYHWLQQKGGERWGMESGYAALARKRGNVDFITEARVLKLVLDGRKVTGVEYERDGRVETIAAGRDVIMALGTFNTPQTLMLSGIGPSHELSKQGIEVKHELPGVGQGLHDHLDTWVKQEATNYETLGLSPRVLHRNVADVFRWIFRRRGGFTSNTAEAGGFVKSGPDIDRPDLQLFFCTTIASAQAADSFFTHGWAMHATDLRPHSRGHVGLHSADPHEQPLIQHNFCQDERDMQNLIRGIHIMREITDQPAFKDYVGREVEPGRDLQSDDELRAYIKSHCMTMYHPTSTCAMGTGKMAVTDPLTMKVHGLEGLRIVDASVFPAVTSGNTMAPTIATAERAADLIKAEAA
ncbi:MAG: GMC family oxidoreductase N-terminal domain-containing protein [Roseitalea sp.]|jgi:choline dehydrogenase-like flavoprotein|nr:GMC family oxidoreductase N-terminal domain-containing protein [Roseitalea sp.]MBO6721475.1 GMC family oxidoreductase N-terminal domain-containing protein [Roseitalea sp.]MBO6742032.1 GMC family oxidoreductase N-terminal domain-containing protein [Roseitalea sp.]